MEVQIDPFGGSEDLTLVRYEHHPGTAGHHAERIVLLYEDRNSAIAYITSIWSS